MLKTFRKWLSERTAQRPQRSRDQRQPSGQEVRESRASMVVALQAEVRTLQQDITDLTSAWDSGTDQSDREVATARLRALEHALDQKQEELSKIQGRI